MQVVARDVAYELVPFMQRRNLHARLAEALASTLGNPVVPPATVAYHWAQSCRLPAGGGVDPAELPRVLKASFRFFTSSKHLHCTHLEKAVE